ncbi:MAG: pantetheine-phosphate adenylyltransferase [Sedimentisphaerales bacterium]|nr:pantetheine-phosphate adenylyltransferase [Sedimentisphaerales bacterium]
MSPNKLVRAVFPGSFDPITNGHLDVIQRGVKIFDELIVAVGVNPEKHELFTADERVQMIKELVKDIPYVIVETYQGLTVDYVRSTNAQVMLRGLRSLTDVQYELQLALTNRAVAGIETVFIMTSEKYGFTTSTLIREVGRLGGDVSGLIPDSIYALLKERLARDKPPTSDDIDS